MTKCDEALVLLSLVLIFWLVSCRDAAWGSTSSGSVTDQPREVIGYSHLLARALSLGRGASTGEPTAARHDTLVVVLHGTATLGWAGAAQAAGGEALALAAGGFALVPAQTAVSYAARAAEGVDLLLVEVASALS